MALIFNINDQQVYRGTVLSHHVWKTIFDWLNKIDGFTPTDNHNVDNGSGIKAVIEQIVLPPDRLDYFEAHRKHIDVHFCIDGSEIISFSSDTKLEIFRKYNEENDTTLLQTPSHFHKVTMVPGTIAIILPEEAHQPLKIVPPGTLSFVRKAIVKLPVSALH